MYRTLYDHTNLPTEIIRLIILDFVEPVKIKNTQDTYLIMRTEFLKRQMLNELKKIFI